MLKLSNFKSGNDHISFNMSVNRDEFRELIPKRTDYSDLREATNKFHKESSSLQMVVSHGGKAVENYRETRSELIETLKVSTSDMFAIFKQINTELKAGLNAKDISQEEELCLETLNSLSNLKNEYELLANIKSRVNSLTREATTRIEKKILFYKGLNKTLNAILKGELKAGITLLNEDSYSFEVYGLPVQSNFDNSIEFINYKEYLTSELDSYISKMIESLVEKKKILKSLMVSKFNPWDSFEDSLTVEEFLRARAEVANFWNSEFSFTENLAHHYFKCRGFYQFFEDKLLEKLNVVKRKIDAKALKLQTQFSISENILNLYGSFTVSKFLSEQSLRVVNSDGIPKAHHNSFNILKSTNSKLAEVVWRETEKNIAKKLGGKVSSPGVIVRDNKQDSKLTMKTELIVISGQNSSEDPKMILNGKFKDLISTKSENLTEIIELEYPNGSSSVDLDLKLSYFLTSNKLAA